MLIYEKENKLNIKFDSENGESLDNPDFSLYKDNEDKVVISANGETSEPGSSSGGSSSGGLVVQFTITSLSDNNYTSDLTANEVIEEFNKGTNVVFHFNKFEGYDDVYNQPVYWGLEGYTVMISHTASRDASTYGKEIITITSDYNNWSLIDSSSNPIDLSDNNAKIVFNMYTD